jgi:hypothetical protein
VTQRDLVGQVKCGRVKHVPGKPYSCMASRC